MYEDVGFTSKKLAACICLRGHSNPANEGHLKTGQR
jgi:hypothetical protein